MRIPTSFQMLKEKIERQLNDQRKAALAIRQPSIFQILLEIIERQLNDQRKAAPASPPLQYHQPRHRA